MSTTFTVLKFNAWLKLVAYPNIQLQGVGREREEREGEEKRRTTCAPARLICVGRRKRRGPSAELHRYRLDGRSSMGPCRRRWRKYKSRASGGNGAGRGGALLLSSSAPSTYPMSTTFTVLKFNAWLKLVAYANIALQREGWEGAGGA